METTTKPGFRLGRCCITKGASLALQEAGQAPSDFLRRHELADYGSISKEDWQSNDEAVQNGDRVLSAYTTRTGKRIWIITEAGRHITTILLPMEY